jgi:hypothetical protein
MYAYPAKEARKTPIMTVITDIITEFSKAIRKLVSFVSALKLSTQV